MAIYIGFFRANDDYVQEHLPRIRETGELLAPELRQKVLDQFDKLPASVKAIGVYRPVATAWTQASTHPGVWIAETDDPAELDFINNLWAGFIDFEWVPAVGLGSTAQDAEAAVDAMVRR